MIGRRCLFLFKCNMYTYTVSAVYLCYASTLANTQVHGQTGVLCAGTHRDAEVLAQHGDDRHVAEDTHTDDDNVSGSLNGLIKKFGARSYNLEFNCSLGNGLCSRVCARESASHSLK